MMIRLSQIKRGMFRNIAFDFIDVSSDHGRRGPLHEYPKRDTPRFEDLGRKARQYSIDCVIVGNDWLDKRNALIKACEQAGSGTLIHPTDGVLKVHCTACHKQDSQDKIGATYLTLTFVETGDKASPATKTDTAAPVDKAADKARDRTKKTFDKQYKYVGQPGMVQTGTLAEIFGTIKKITKIVKSAQSIIGAALSYYRYVRNLAGNISRLSLNDLTRLVTKTSDTVGSLSSLHVIDLGSDLASMRAAGAMIGQYTGLAGQLSGVVGKLSGLFVGAGGSTFGSWSQQRRLGPARAIARSAVRVGSDPQTGPTSGGYNRDTILTVIRYHLAIHSAFAGHVVAASRQDVLDAAQAIAADGPQAPSTVPTSVAVASLFAAFTPATASPPAGAPVTAMAASDVPPIQSSAGAVNQLALNQQAIAALIRQSTLIEAAQALSTLPLDSRAEALSLRDQVCGALDDEIDDASDDDLVQSLRDLRLALTRDIQARLVSLPQALAITLPHTMPAILIAYQVYGDPDRADEIIRRNPTIRHPLFVPAGATLDLILPE